MATKVYPFEQRGEFGEDGRRVLSLKRVPGGVRVREECDGYFFVVLNPEQIEAFIACLREVAAQPEPEAAQK